MQEFLVRGVNLDSPHAGALAITCASPMRLLLLLILVVASVGAIGIVMEKRGRSKGSTRKSLQRHGSCDRRGNRRRRRWQVEMDPS